MNQNDIEMSGPEMDYFMNEDLCDVVFEVEGQRIPAPKQVLSLKSEVFRAMFSGKYKESADKVIPIEDTTVEAFKTFIRFFICEQLVFSDDNDFETILQVFRLSDKYQVCRLSNKVLDLIKVRPNLFNFTVFTRFVFHHNLEQLKTIVIEFIDKNFNEIIFLKTEELSEINDCTNNLLFDKLTTGRRMNELDTLRLRLYSINSGHRYVYLTPAVIKKGKFTDNNRYDGSFEALKVLIGFLYFNRLIIKDKNDFKLIRKVCDLSVKYSVNGLMIAISADLKNRITFESLDSILKIIIDFEIKDLIEKVFDFIQTNIESLVRSDVKKLNSKSKSDLIRGNYKVVDKLNTSLGLIERKAVLQRKNDLFLIRDILNAIQKYKVFVELKERIAALIVNRITFDNLVIIYKIAVDFNIEDLITNIERFIAQNRRQLSGKDNKELIEMNNSLDNKLLEVLAKY